MINEIAHSNPQNCKVVASFYDVLSNVFKIKTKLHDFLGNNHYKICRSAELRQDLTKFYEVNIYILNWYFNTTIVLKFRIFCCKRLLWHITMRIWKIINTHPALKIGMTPSEHTFNAFQSAWIERKYDLNKSTLFSYIWYEEKIFISYV